MPTEPASLAEVTALAQPIVERIVWATVSTVSPHGEPRARLMHPVWWWDGAVPLAIVAARPTPIKVRHLIPNAAVSCSYWDAAHDTVTIDATARWLTPPERAEAWERVKAVPAPVGFDPAIIWGEGPTQEDCGFLHLTAHRIVATPAGRVGVRWSSRQPGRG